MTPRKPSAKQVDAAIEQSAEHLAASEDVSADAHPKPTTPTKAEVESAVEQSSEHLESQVVAEEQAKVMDAAPVSAGSVNPGLDAAPISAARDMTQDAAPVFSDPIRDTPKE